MHIKINNCSFSYGKNKIIENMNLTIENNETVVILGHNGAGKTTLLKIIAKILEFQEGEYEFNFGNCVMNLDTSQLISEFDCFDNLVYFSKLYKYKYTKEQINKLIDDVGLNSYRNVKAKNLSTGNKQKLMICRAILVESETTLLDEPTSGLDPISKKTVHNLLKKMKQQNKNIIIASHDLEETLEIADRIIFINKGQIIFDENLQMVKSLLSRDIYETSEYIDGYYLIDDDVNKIYIGTFKPGMSYSYTFRKLKLIDIYCLLIQGEYDTFISKTAV